MAFSSCEKSSESTESSGFDKKAFTKLVSQGDFAEAKAKMLESSAPEIYDLADILYGDWIAEIMASEDNRKTAKIIQLLGEYPIKGSRIEGLQDYFFNSVGILNPYEFRRNDDNDGWYAEGSSHFNKLCDKILNTAILLKEYEVADIIIQSYMQDPELTQGSSSSDVVVDGKKIDGDHSYMKYTWKSRDAAIKKLKEAKQKK